MSDPYRGADATQAPPDRVFVGIDLSLTSTGIAIIDGGRITVDRVTSKPTKGGTTADQAARIDAITGTILDRIPLFNGYAHVGVEGPSYGSTGSAAHILGGLWWGMRIRLNAYRVDTLVVPPGSVKKYATGKGNAGKDEVLAAVIRRYPQVDVGNNDEADALVIAAITARYHGFPFDLSLPVVNEAAMKGVGR